MMWETIKFVTTPIALIAFLAAVVAYIYQLRTAATRDLILTAPESKRAGLIQGTIRDFAIIDTDSLESAQKYEIVLQSLRHREKRLKHWATFSLLLALILCASAVALAILGAKDKPTTDNAPAAQANTAQVTPNVDWDTFVYWGIRLKKPAHWYYAHNSEGTGAYAHSPDDDDISLNIFAGPADEMKKEQDFVCKDVMRIHTGGKGIEHDGTARLEECTHEATGVPMTAFLVEIDGNIPNTLVMCSYVSSKAQQYRKLCQSIVASAKYVGNEAAR